MILPSQLLHFSTQAWHTLPHPDTLGVELMLQHMHAAVEQEGQP